MPVTEFAYKMIEAFYGETYARRFFFIYSTVNYRPKHAR